MQTPGNLQTPARAPIWLWPSLLSLDAPTVALVWQDFLARCFPCAIRPASRAALGLTVWAIYITDRLLDVRHVAEGEETTRHAFYRRHGQLAKVMLACAICADLLVCFWVRPAVIERGLLVAGAIGVYLAAFPWSRRKGDSLKKVAAGVLFTCGVFLAPAVISESIEQLALPAVSFFILCVENLFLTENSEHGGIRLAGICLTCLLVGGNKWFLAVSTAAGGLCILTLFSRRVTTDARGVLADAMLLAPLLFR